MTQADLAPQQEVPLNPRQLAFARYLGIAIAKGGRDTELVEAYVSAGYAADRGNARRLAADPRIRAIADEACAAELRIAGLRIEYLQGKALELLHATPTKVFRQISKFIATEQYGEGENLIVRFKLRDDLTPEEEAELDSAAWPLTEFKIDKDGIIAIKLPDKKALIEMLGKQLGVGRDDNSTNVNLSLESLVVASMQSAEKAA